MKLEEWLLKKKMSVCVLAAHLYTNKATIYHWLKGIHKPSSRSYKLIEKVTQGQVTKKDWE